jgi:integrase
MMNNNDADDAKCVRDFRNQMFIGEVSVTNPNGQTTIFKNISTDNPMETEQIIEVMRGSKRQSELFVEQLQGASPVSKKETRSESEAKPVIEKVKETGKINEITDESDEIIVKSVESLTERVDRYKLSSRMAEYLDELSEKKRSPRYLKAVKYAIELFTEYTGDLKASLIHEGHTKKFAKDYAQLPANRTLKPEYRNKSLQELLKMAIPDADKITEITFNNNLSKLSAFFNWMLDEGLTPLTKNPFRKLFKEEASADEQWDAFTRRDISIIFGSSKFTFNEKKPSRYWVPLLIAHSGARVEEICALYEDDFDYDKETKIWFFHVRKNRPDKHIKNKMSCRKIPVHDRLLKLGLEEYIKSLPKGTRLFPDLTYVQDLGYHRNVSRAFPVMLERIGLTVAPDEKKTLKSFRHSVSTELYNNGIAAELIEEIVGHGHDSSNLSLSRYHKGYYLQKKKEALDTVQWDFY